MASSGDDIMMNKLLELKRLEREELISKTIFPGIFTETESYKKLSNEEKCIEYSLMFIDFEVDMDLYDTLKKLYKIEWHPSAYQCAVEDKMISEIHSKRENFDTNSSQIYAGDIVLYFANYISKHVHNISMASACEILLINIGVYPDPGDKILFRKAWNAVSKSDELPNKVSMFDQEYYDICSVQSNCGDYFIPTWDNQCKDYICKLNPGSWSLNKS